MAQKIRDALPPDLDLPANWTIRFAALDPSSGAAVAGVKISDASLTVTNVAGTDDTLLQTGPFMLVPGPEA